MTPTHTDGSALARASDPKTAHDAAGAMGHRLGQMHERIIASLSVSCTGRTTSEIAVAIGEPRDSVSPRMRDLVRAGKVRDSGVTRVPAGHRRAAIVWTLTGTPQDRVLAALEGL